MKRAGGASFCVTLLLCLMQQGVPVGGYETGAVRNHERAHEIHNENTVKMIRENGSQREENSVQRAYSLDPREHTRSGDKNPPPRIQVPHTDTIAATRSHERSDRNPNHVRTSGNGAPVDDSTERMNHHQFNGGSGTTERTNSGPRPPPPPRSGEEARLHTRHGTTISRDRPDGSDTTFDSRTQTHEELYDRRSHSGQHVNVRERPAPKTASNRPSPDERTGGEEEKPAVQTKTEPHPIGLINALEGKATKGRSMDLDPRELDTTTTIIAAALIGFAVMIFMLFCIAELAKRRREKKADSTRLLRVFQYLHEFNVDDIDIQLSAAGGFHVGYLNGLAQGINTKKQSDQKTDTSSDDGENGSGSLSKKV